MPDRVGAYHDNGTPAYWIEEGTNKPYSYLTVNGKETGQKVYMSPYTMMSPEQAAATKPKDGGLFHGKAEWDTKKGEWKVPVAGGNIAAMAVGGALAAPFAAPAISSFLGGGAAPAASGSTATGGSLTASPLVGGVTGAVPGAGMSGSIGGGSMFGLGDIAKSFIPGPGDGLKALGSFFENRSEGKRLEQARQDQLHQLMAQFLMNDPRRQLSMDLRRSVAEGWRPGSGQAFTGTPNLSAYDPEALASNRQRIMDYLSSGMKQR